MTPRPLLALALALLLPGCGILSALSEVGHPPIMSPTANPTLDPQWRPVTMPMPGPSQPPREANSLWRPGARAFFKDQRAARVGDIVTIMVNMNDNATMNDNTLEQRTENEQMGMPNMFGLAALLPKILNKSANPTSLANATSTSNLTTIGQIQRNENIVTSIAGTITQVLPNGNLVVVARQEMVVNDELRQVEVTGVVRPEDIRSDNTIAHDRIAEARITYSGRGQLTTVNEPRWGDQVLQALLPF